MTLQLTKKRRRECYKMKHSHQQHYHEQTVVQRERERESTHSWAMSTAINASTSAPAQRYINNYRIYSVHNITLFFSLILSFESISYMQILIKTFLGIVWASVFIYLFIYFLKKISHQIFCQLLTWYLCVDQVCLFNY